ALSATGGLAVTGLALQRTTGSYIGSAGLTFGGLAEIDAAGMFSHTATGGVSLSATATQKTTGSFAASGPITITGPASQR
ncbi:hypothetical protein ABTM76_20385, partial [Acinetobacter baumannii]